MSEEQDRRLYEHFKNLTEGNMKSGNPVRDELIVSDATRHLADLLKKRTKRGAPNFEEETKVEEPKEEIKTKSVRKK